MPLTDFQDKLVALFAKNRSEDSHLAGGAALHFEPQTRRYSDDLDYFHDSEQRVGHAFAQDKELLLRNGYSVEIEMSQPGYIRCLIKKGREATKVEWARDSSWRFMPALKHKKAGYILHPVDLTINKLLALAGRDEARDFLDVLDTNETILPLGAQIWAACGKDPGLNPKSLLELLKRRGKYHQADFDRLHLRTKVDLQQLRQKWREAIDQAEDFIQKASRLEVGVLFYSKRENRFTQPEIPLSGVQLHFGRPGGVLPIIKEE